MGSANAPRRRGHRDTPGRGRTGPLTGRTGLLRGLRGAANNARVREWGLSHGEKNMNRSSVTSLVVILAFSSSVCLGDSSAGGNAGPTIAPDESSSAAQ